MRIKAKLLATMSAALLLGVAGVAGIAKAADTDTKEPGDQALTSISKNLKKDPDNRGLLTAQQRIERNQLRQEQREMARPERPQRPERPERAGRM